MHDIQKSHMLGAKYRPLLSREKLISSRDLKNKRKWANRTQEVRRASCRKERPTGNLSSLYFGVDIQQS